MICLRLAVHTYRHIGSLNKPMKNYSGIELFSALQLLLHWRLIFLRWYWWILLHQRSGQILPVDNEWKQIVLFSISISHQQNDLCFSTGYRLFLKIYTGASLSSH